MEWNYWSEVNDLNAARFGIAGVGTTANCLGIGGSLPGYTTQTEEWNLTRSVGAWSTGGSLNTARSGSAGTSAGSQTACLMVSGYNGTALVTNNESYNGSTWMNLQMLT